MITTLERAQAERDRLHRRVMYEFGSLREVDMYAKMGREDAIELRRDYRQAVKGLRNAKAAAAEHQEDDMDIDGNVAPSEAECGDCDRLQGGECADNQECVCNCPIMLDRLNEGDEQ